MTLTERAVCTIYTGIAFCRGDELNAVYEYAEMLLGRPVHTAELGSEYIALKLSELSGGDFAKICNEIPLGFVLGEKENKNESDYEC